MCILDVGCGNGAYARALPDRVVFGVDYQLFPTWSATAGRFAVSEAGQLPFHAESFDTVASFETLEHLADPIQVLHEYRRVTRKNIVITVPHCEITPGQRASSLIYNHWVDPTHRNFWTLSEIQALIEGNGFAVQTARLINNIDMSHVVREAYGYGLVGRALTRALFRLVPQRQYGMTSLVVAEKM